MEGRGTLRHTWSAGRILIWVLPFSLGEESVEEMESGREEEEEEMEEMDGEIREVEIKGGEECNIGGRGWRG